MICEQLGQEPNPDEIPIDPATDFDRSAQQALYIFTILPDKIEGMAGMWLGKDFGGIGDIFEIYNVANKRDTMDYLVYMIQIARESYNAERERQLKKK